MSKEASMNVLKRLFYAILVFALLLSLTSCYFISAQPMSKLKGTYKLTSYTYTPKHERKEGYTAKTRDYINDAEYKYEDYLIITGTGQGFYAHKDASGESYVKEITLRYEYSQDDSSKIEYVIFNDSITVNADDGGVNRLGVSKKQLNYTKAALDYNELITKKPMQSESISVRWEKVDNATDLSFVNGQISNMKYYKYDAFCVRGIYEINTYVNSETLEHLRPHQYFFIVIDTAYGINEANIYYATTEAPTEQIKRTVTFSANEDFTVLTIDGTLWKVDENLGKPYYSSTDGIYTVNIRLASNNISTENIEYYISSNLPTAE